MFRLLRVLVSAVSLSGLVVACASAGTPQVPQTEPSALSTQPEEAAAPTSEPQAAAVSAEITYADIYSSWPAYQDLMNSFLESCAESENIVVNPTYETMEEFTTKLQAGEDLPDVMVLSFNETLRMSAEGLLLDVEDRLPGSNKDDYMAAALQFSLAPLEKQTSNGSSTDTTLHTYGLPKTASVLVLFYNKALFEKAGLDPKIPPNTMDDLYAYAEKLAGAGIDYGFMLPGGGYFILPFLYAYGGGLYDLNENRVKVNDSATIDAFNLVLSLNNNPGGEPPDPYDPAEQYQKAVDTFTSGQTGMIINGSWAVPEILASPEFMDKDLLGVAMIPAGPGGQQGSPISGANYSISAKSNYPEEAFRLISCLNSTENQVKLATEIYMMPSLKSAYEKLSEDTGLSGLLAQVSQKQMDVVPANTVVDTIPAFLNDFSEVSDQVLMGEPAEGPLDELGGRWQDRLGLGFCCAIRWQFCCNQ